MSASQADRRVDLNILRPSPWQMTPAEKVALEGLLADLRPQLAVEIGTCEGGSLELISSYAEEVHSFDLVAPHLPVAERPGVHLHGGDSHVLLEPFLDELAAADRNVDFALVDGDHSADGARRDVLDLVESDACQATVIIMHDAANPEVRRGLEQARLHEHPKVSYVDLDFIVSCHYVTGGATPELWGGLGLAVVGATTTPTPSRDVEPIEIVRAGFDRRVLGADQVTQLQARAERADRVIADLTGSASWKLTAPLRAVKRRLRR